MAAIKYKDPVTGEWKYAGGGSTECDIVIEDDGAGNVMLENAVDVTGQGKEMKTLNGYEIVDVKAREDIESLKKNGGGGIDNVAPGNGSGGEVEYIEKVTSDNKFDNVFDEQGKIDGTTGENLNASTIHRTADFREFDETIPAGTRICIVLQNISDNAGNVTICFYDENKEYVSYEYFSGISLRRVNRSYDKDIRYFRVAKPIAWAGQIYVSPIDCPLAEIDNCDYTYTKELVPVGGGGGIVADVNKKLTGKVVVNFGDSIFGKRRPPDDISTELADITGATVYNCGFGGCHMSNHWTTTYNAFSMCNLADAIVSSDWTTQDAAIAETETHVVPTYFAEALEILKGLDFDTVDIITIAYGTNDWNSGDAVDNVENPRDKESFASALRYSVETLLTAFPHLKIFVCSQTYRFFLDDANAFTEDSDTKPNVNGVKLTDFVAKTKEVAEQYHLPYIDNYNIGINKFNRGYYFPATDGTHPLTVGCHLIAENMANEMY